MKNWFRLRTMRVSLGNPQFWAVAFILVALAYGAASEFTVKPLPLPGAHGVVMLDYFSYDRDNRRLWVPAASN